MSKVVFFAHFYFVTTKTEWFCLRVANKKLRMSSSNFKRNELMCNIIKVRNADVQV